MRSHRFIALLGLSVCTYAAGHIITSQSRDNKEEQVRSINYTQPVKNNKTVGIAHVDAITNESIQAPDAPQSVPTTPNSIQDLKMANPGEGITVIGAPVANEMGSAAVSLPIKIPDGRNGMEPELNIAYNSDGGNGWLGLDWNLYTSAINIETRWGVPRYDNGLETETYLMDGQQLSPVAHRAEAVARSAEKQFYPRVEETFEKIIRHGSNPTQYWWEVTDKNGTRNFYGGTPAGGVDATAVLTTAGGNIAHWALTETRDLNGNFVKYRYAKVADAGINGGSPGYSLYPSSITYTGNGSTEGKYSIVFTRDRELGETKRADVIINARSGFKQVTADLLRKIAVKYNGQDIRSYQLNYVQGAFYKTLLQGISEFDAAGALFNTHSFEYYNDVLTAPLTASEEWVPQNDNIRGSFINPIQFFDDKASMLGGNKSLGGGFGIAVTVGPYDANLALKTNTAGVSFGFNYSKNEGMLALVDINGDALIDKVYKKGGQLYFRPNQSGPDGTHTFGAERSIGNLSDFNKGESFVIDVGLESHFGIFAGFEYAHTEDLTSIYFSDVNGDMLMDVVKDGRVYFNHLDSNGNPSFTTSSGDTPSPINSASNIDGSLAENDPVAFEKSVDDNPLHDVVKVWRAPFNGTVSITGNAALIQDVSPDALAYTAADGVRVAIQHKGFELWSTDIAANDFTAKTPSGVNAINVLAGDKIYFRVQSKFNGAYDQVSWEPQVTYSIQAPGLNDANGLPLYQFNAKNDFLISGPLSAGMGIDGQIRITGDFAKPITSDDVLVQIIKKSGAIITTLLSTTLAANLATTVPISITNNVLKNDALFFSVSSATNVDWAALQWKPFVFYNSTTDPAITQLFDPVSGNPLLYTYPAVDFQSFNRTITASVSWTVPVSDTFSIQANPGMFFNLKSGDIVFTVKKQNQLLVKQVIPASFGVVGAHAPISLILNSGDKLFFEYHVKNEELANFIHTPSVTVDADPGDPVNLTAGFHTTDNSFLFGPMYRHWGQFAYNGNRARAGIPIIESDLHLDESLTNPPTISLNGADDPDEMQNIYDNAGGNKPKDNKFIYLAPDNEHSLWIGYDNLTYVKKDVISSSRMNKDNLIPVNPITNPSPGGGSGAAGITKVANTDNFSLAAGIGPAGASASFGWTKYLYDFNDINGDKYPDILSTSKIQYTHPYGGLESAAKNFSFGDVVRSDHFSLGFTLGGTFLRSNAPNSSSTSKGAKAGKAGDQSQIAAGISGNFNYNKDSTAYAWMDINGDELPDRVYRDGTVELNLGYSFLPAEQWGFNGVQEGTALSFGAGLSINISSYSISVGIGLSRSENETERTLQDMNGDGLLDYIFGVNPLRVAINKGNGFAAPVEWTGADAIHKATATGESVNGAFTVGIALVPPVLVAKLCINPSFNVAQGADKTRVQFDDIDGDGYPDFLRSEQDNSLSVSRSTIRRTNKLKKVNRPLGANFTLDYKRIGNTYDMPNSVWALAGIDVYDGVAGDGADHIRSSFDYEGGRFDRHEREFYGFKKVITKHLDTQNGDVVYRKSETEYLNDNYYEKGLVKSEVLKNAAGNKFEETVNDYELKDIHTGATLPASIRQSDDGTAFPALVHTRDLFYEGGAVAGKATGSSFVHDVLGNVTTIIDSGDAGAGDDLTKIISYHSVPAKYIMSVPSGVTVSGGGSTLRQNQTSIDNNTGNVTEIRQYLENGDVAKTNMEYDVFGNVTKLTRPQNVTGQRLSLNYEYDGDVQMYKTKITDAYGYVSSSIYDVRFGQALSSTDINNQKTLVSLDNAGRIITITGPLEIAGGQTFTIAYEYHPEATVPWALVKHFDPAHPANFIETATFADGLGRVVQTKKDGAIFTGANAPDQEVMIVSGADRFDAFGRTVSTYYPTTEAKGTTGVLNNAVDGVAPATVTFDVLDRMLTVTLPGNAVTTMQYAFGADRNGVQQFKTTSIDRNGIKQEGFKNVRQLLTSIKRQHSQGTDVWTSFEYNAIDEPIKVTDDKGNKIISAYDRLGRRVSVTHPDAGLTIYEYDLNGNLTKQTTANLQGGNGIKYNYDRERLVNVVYPLNPLNNVMFTYGAPGAASFGAGRIIKQQDASGTQEFFHNPLGMVVKEKRVINIPSNTALTHITQWTYDTWNRLTGMIYPDGEALTYNYNVGGMLHDMSGINSGTAYNYLPQAGYDKFENKIYQRYGNGTEMTYAFEPDRRRLQKMTAKTAAGRLMMDNSYTYDKENNILSIVNNAPVPPSNLMGGKSDYHYTYDDLYRLTNATGIYTGSSHQHRYTVSMQYDNLYNITSKQQVHERKGNGANWVTQNQTTYSYSYNYNVNGKPHSAIHVGENAYQYDANGNQVDRKHDVSAQNRKTAWDEENRMKTLSDNGQTFNYTYDGAGERVLKSTGQLQSVSVNGKPVTKTNGLGNYVVYVNPYVVVRSGQFTKHFYIEEGRIVSKLGESGNGNSSAKAEANGNGNGNNQEAFQFYYHPDHLGNTAFVTDRQGEVYQHLEYFPFGETMIEEHGNQERTPYLYNAKELDEETGLYYYGARYYETRTSTWQSVDPLWDLPDEIDKSPYAYVLNNPLSYNDPDGAGKDDSYKKRRKDPKTGARHRKAGGPGKLLERSAEVVIRVKAPAARALRASTKEKTVRAAMEAHARAKLGAGVGGGRRASMVNIESFQAKSKQVGWVDDAGIARTGLKPAYSDYKARIKITYKGSRPADYVEAFALTGVAPDPDYVWHHYHDYKPTAMGGVGQGTMYYMKRSVHEALDHYGGVHQYKYHHGAAGY